MGTIVRGKVVRDDLAMWDGKTATATRVDATGGTITGLAINDYVDVLQVFGGGTARTVGTLNDAISHIGTSNDVAIRLAPGTWTIDSNLTIPANFSVEVPAGVLFNISSGVTLTISGHLRAGLYQIFSGDGTVATLPKNSPVYPQWWGATGDGTTDDTDAINAAFGLDNAVYFLNGSYYTASGVSTAIGANKFVGDGIETRIKSDGANHTLSILSGDNDLLIDSLWIDNTLGSGNWDAINILGTETRIRHVDIDDAPRYGIYIGAYRTQISQVQMQAVLDTGIYILSTATLNNISDVNFVIAGAKIPGKCIDVQSDFNTITGVIADQCIGYVLNLAGNYNVVSAITARQPGGATANDFIRVGGNSNTVTSATCDNTTGIGYLITGGANTLRGCVSTDSSGIGVSITGSNNTFEGRIFNAGAGSGTVHGVSITGSNNNVNALVQTSSGDDLNITGDYNAVRGEFTGTVVITSTSEGNNLDIRCGSIALDSASQEHHISAVCTADSGTIADIASNGNTLALRINEGGTIGCRVGGSKNVGFISAFGSSDTCIEVDGDYNSLQVYASGATGEEMRVGGSQNMVEGTIEGDVVVEGDNNVLMLAISGNITFNAGADNNRLIGYVGGSITDNGIGNDTTQAP